VAQERVEFLFAAQVEGQQQMQKLIASVDSLRAETEKLKGANAGLASSTETVIRNGTRYNNAMDAQAKQLRNARQGSQQLGMQMNDLATSFSTGASLSQALNQQLGQVGYALSMMGGRLGAVGTFLAGPWGAAITIGIMALSPFINKLGEMIFQTEKAESALTNLINKQRQLSKERLAPVEAEMELQKLIQKRDRMEAMPKRKSRGVLDITANNRDQNIRDINMQIAEAQAAIAASNYAARKIGGDLNSNRATGGRASGGGGVAMPKISEAQKAADALKEFELKEQNKALEHFNSIVNGLTTKTLPDYEVKMREAFAAEAALTSEQQIANAQRFGAAIDAIDAKRIADDFKLVGDELKDGLLPQLAAVQDTWLKGKEDMLSAQEPIKGAFETIGNAVSDAFKGMLTGANSFKEGMRGIINSVISELWRLYVVQQIVGFVTKAIGGITGMTLPGKAVGGSVNSNKPYMVGEKGPELFIPRGNGTIIPNHNMKGGGGANGINITVDARGSSDPAAVRAQVQQGILEAAPAIIAAAEARTNRGLRRPRLAGVMQ
jgi:hypothetical protein